ncbi:MAG: rhodanese-related sulfurtransferase [Gammaproteobacteria bacterium]
MSACRTAAFYRFVDLPDFRELRAPVRAACERHHILGTILLAREGINGTIAGAPDSVRALFAQLAQDSRLADLEIKEASVSEPPFYRLKVRLKKEIVTLNVEGVDPVTQAGEYVEPRDWNALLDDPDVTVIDTRNDYEVALGTFDGAVDPQTRSFGELPQWLDEQTGITSDTRVAMFCTGGIRCEKSTALLRSRGVKQVYHLRGGILNYLEKIEPQDNRFDGHCFVFDERVAVDADLRPGPYTLCRACRIPLSTTDILSPDFVEGVSCARCIDRTTEDQKARFAERHRQMTLAKARDDAHLGRREQELHVLYSFRRCPYAMRARMALRVAGVAVELREVVLRDKPKSMLDASPKGTVPVLVAGASVLDESLSIMRFALGRHDPDQWLSPQTDDASTMRALIEQCDDDFKYHLDRYKYATRYEDVDPAEHRAAGARFLEQLDARLQIQPFLFGARRCLADVAIAPFVRQFRIADPGWFDAQPTDALREWLATFEAWPVFQSVMDKYAPWQSGDVPVLM